MRASNSFSGGSPAIMAPTRRSRSAPAEKLPPAPVTIPTRRASSPSSSSHASASRQSTSGLMALRLSGRFRVMVRTGPSRSRSTAGSDMPSGSSRTADRKPNPVRKLCPRVGEEPQAAPEEVDAGRDRIRYSCAAAHSRPVHRIRRSRTRGIASAHRRSTARCRGTARRRHGRPARYQGWLGARPQRRRRARHRSAPAELSDGWRRFPAEAGENLVEHRGAQRVPGCSQRGHRLRVD